mgnify:CR=1 FL=1
MVSEVLFFAWMKVNYKNDLNLININIYMILDPDKRESSFTVRSRVEKPGGLGLKV